MRLTRYINENKSFAEWAPTIEKDCSKFIKDIRGSKGTLTRIDRYMGSRESQNPVIKKYTQKERRVMDTPKKLSDEIDKIFKEKFKWKARTKNVVFCWGTPFNSADINDGFLVFPAGNYYYVWSQYVNDLYGSIISFKGKNKGKTYWETSDFIEIFKNKIIKTYTNMGLKKAVVSQNEIMVRCEYYYLIRPELIEMVNERFNLKWQGAKFTGRKIT